MERNENFVCRLGRTCMRGVGVLLAVGLGLFFVVALVYFWPSLSLFLQRFTS